MVSDFKKQYVDQFYYVNVSQLNRFMDPDENNVSSSCYNNGNDSNNNNCNNNNKNNNCNNRSNNKNEALLSNYFVVLPSRDNNKKKLKASSTSVRTSSISSIPSLKSYTSEINTPSPVLTPITPLPSPLLELSSLSSSPPTNHCRHKKVYIHKSAVYHPIYYKKFKFWICIEKPPPISDRLTLNYPPFFLLPSRCQGNDRCSIEVDFNDYPWYQPFQQLQQQKQTDHHLSHPKPTRFSFPSIMDFLGCCFCFPKNNWIPMRRINTSSSLSLYKPNESWKLNQNNDNCCSNQGCSSQDEDDNNKLNSNNEYWLKSNHILEPYTFIFWAKLIHWLLVYVFRYQSPTNRHQLSIKNKITPLKEIVISNQDIVKDNKKHEKDDEENNKNIKNNSPSPPLSPSPSSANIAGDTLVGMSSALLKDKIIINDKSDEDENIIIELKNKEQEKNVPSASTSVSTSLIINSNNNNNDDNNDSSLSIYKMKKLEKSITIPTTLSRSSFISKPILKRTLSNPAKLTTLLSIRNNDNSDNNNNNDKILVSSAIALANISFKGKGKYKDKWTLKKKNALLLSANYTCPTKETTAAAHIVVTSPRSSKLTLTHSSNSSSIIASSSSSSLSSSLSLPKQQKQQRYQFCTGKEEKEEDRIVKDKWKGKGKALPVNDNFNNEIYHKQNNTSCQHLDTHQQYSSSTNSEEEDYDNDDYEEEIIVEEVDHDSDNNNNSINKSHHL